MNLLATLRVALNALRVNLLRSILTMLGVIIGVAAVIKRLHILPQFLGIDIATLSLESLDEEIMDRSCELPRRPDAHDLCSGSGIRTR